MVIEWLRFEVPPEKWEAFFAIPNSLFPIPKKRHVFGSLQNCSVPNRIAIG